MSGFGADVRNAIRQTVRAPWSSAATILTLALGIGAATAAFSVFNHILLRPTPGVWDPDRLVVVQFQPADDPLSTAYTRPSMLEPLRQGTPALGGLAHTWTSELAYSPSVDASPRDVEVEFGSSGYLQLLGVRPRLGRLFTDREADEPGHDVALISDRLWRSEFGAAAVVGRSIFIGGHPFQIVGVLDDYAGWSATQVTNVEVWLPAGAAAAATGRASSSMSTLVGRLAGDATATLVQEQLRAAHSGAAGTLEERIQRFVPTVYPGLQQARDRLLRQRVADTYWIAMAGALLLLLLACANAANLLLARGVRGAGDLALRAAIGGTRWRLVRGLLVESTVLAALAAGGGLVLAIGLTRALAGEQLFRFLPAMTPIEVDWRVALFATCAAAGTIVLAALLPALTASRVDLRHLLHQRTTAPRSTRRLRAAFVVAQLSLSVVLLTTALAFARSLNNLRSQDLGMDADDVVSFAVRAGRADRGAEAFVREIINGLRQIPGARTVAYASPPAFFASGRFGMNARPDQSTPAGQADVETVVVSGSYFEALDITVRGRTFTDGEFLRDAGDRGGVAVISEALAQQAFGQAPPIGRRLFLGRDREGVWTTRREVEVVGVASDVLTGASFKTGGDLVLYWPGPMQYLVATFYVETPDTPAQVLNAAREVVRRLEPNLPLSAVGTVRDEIERLIPEDRMFARVSGLIAVVALMLSVCGVFAVSMHSVAERWREFGIRMALGAPAHAVGASVLLSSTKLAVPGLAAGLAACLWASGFIDSRLFGVSALDPLTLAGTCVVLLGAALIAAWLPARRATRVDPMIALRCD